MQDSFFTQQTLLCKIFNTKNLCRCLCNFKTTSDPAPFFHLIRKVSFSLSVILSIGEKAVTISCVAPTDSHIFIFISYAFCRSCFVAWAETVPTQFFTWQFSADEFLETFLLRYLFVNVILLFDICDRLTAEREAQKMEMNIFRDSRKQIRHYEWRSRAAESRLTIRTRSFHKKSSIN